MNTGSPEIIERSVEGARFIFSTRIGGYSEGPFASLNLGMLSLDDPETVLCSREAFWQAANLDPARLALPMQVHGDRVAVVMESGYRPERDSTHDAVPETDAIVSPPGGPDLGIFIADCLSVLFCDPVGDVIAAAHAGWRGTALGIAAKTLGVMHDSFRVRPADCWVCLGPRIGPCCYQVGRDVVDVFGGYPAVGEFILEREGGYFLDLAAANRGPLVEAGVDPERILDVDLCTSCHPERFYSHRRDGAKTGRMLAVVSRDRA